MAGIHLTLSKDGKKAVAVYNDNLKGMRPVLGAPVVTRASHVRYDPERELWVAYRAGSDEVLCEHESRDECIKKEVEVLNRTIHKEI